MPLSVLRSQPPHQSNSQRAFFSLSSILSLFHSRRTFRQPLFIDGSFIPGSVFGQHLPSIDSGGFGSFIVSDNKVFDEVCKNWMTHTQRFNSTSCKTGISANAHDLCFLFSSFSFFVSRRSKTRLRKVWVHRATSLFHFFRRY